MYLFDSFYAPEDTIYVGRYSRFVGLKEQIITRNGYIDVSIFTFMYVGAFTENYLPTFT